MAPRSANKSTATRVRTATARFVKRHPNKVRATIAGVLFGFLSGCSTFPLGSTVRLVCGVAESIVKVVEHDSGAGREVDASAASVDSAP